MARRPPIVRGYSVLPEAVRVPGFALWHGVHHSGTELPTHTHDDPTLCYVVRGRFTEYSGGKAIDCVSQDIKLTPAGEPHWNRFAAGETRGLRIDVERGRFTESPAIQRVLNERLHVAASSGAELMHRILVELDAGDEVAAVAVEGLLLELLAVLARDALPRTSSALPRWLAEADDYMRASYAQRISLAGLAGIVGVAPATLARAYRAAFHTTIGERVRQLRIESAARELAQSDEPISVIAVRAGFYDQSHFTNLFRRQLGVTPARYRQVVGARNRSSS